MMYGIKLVVKYMLGTDLAGRNFAVRPDDTMIVSYPRSGNTWTRFLVASSLAARDLCSVHLARYWSSLCRSHQSKLAAKTASAAAE